MDIKWIGCNAKSFQKGRNGTKIDRIVLHWIVGKLSAADATFLSAKGTSAHYGVGPDAIHQYVKEEDTAYHAGNFPFNLRSIGIEHEGGPNLPIDEKTYEKSARLVLDISTRYGIPLDRQHIYKHSEIKATQCPGTLDVDRIISMAKALKGEGEMANTVNITNDKFKELVQKATQSDSVADIFSFDRNDAELAKKVDDKVRELRTNEGNALAKVAELEDKIKKLGEEIAELKSDVEKYATELGTANDTIKTLKSQPPKQVVKTVTVETIVEPKTFGELLSVIKAYFTRSRGGEEDNA